MTRSRRFIYFLDRHLTGLLGLSIFAVAFLTYASTVPPVQVFGDPSEYTFIPWILGIAHPPGYAFYTLLAALWQRLVPIGSVAFRTHLLASTAGALSATLVYLIVLRLVSRQSSVVSRQQPAIPKGRYAVSARPSPGSAWCCTCPRCLPGSRLPPRRTSGSTAFTPTRTSSRCCWRRRAYSC